MKLNIPDLPALHSSAHTLQHLNSDNSVIDEKWFYTDEDMEKYIDDEIMLEQHSSELMTRIKQIQAQVAWIWYHAQNEDRGIMRQRIIQLLKTQ